MLSRRALNLLARNYSVGTRPLLQAAEKADGKVNVGPDNFEIAPSTIPWKNYKNEYYEKRGYTVASKDWVEWKDLPAPYKYLGVKVNPADVENAGPVWKFFSDWRTAVPATILLSMPLWMFNILPPFDERLELALITVSAGWIAVSQAGPMFRQWKRDRVATKVRALLSAEKELNDQIASSMDAFKTGASVVEYVRMVNGAERSLRTLETEAATKKIFNAQRDAMVAQLDYLVQVQASGAADTEAGVVKAARAAVEAALEKEVALQQKSIEAAIKALASGSVAEDIVAPLYSSAVEKARKDEASKPAGAKPLTTAQAVDIFRKRFGYTEDVVSESTLKRAQQDPAAMAVLIGKVGGKTPAVGTPYVLKAPIQYAK